MHKTLLYFFLFISLLLISAGIYLTVLSKEDPSKHKVPQWVTNHLNVMKIVGPVMIGMGVLTLAIVSYCLMNGSDYKSDTGGMTKSMFGYSGCGGDTSKSKSNFGFKFY